MKEPQHGTPAKRWGAFITPNLRGSNFSSGQAFDSDIAAVEHPYPHLMPSKQTHAHKRLRVGRIGLHGPYLPVPKNGCRIYVEEPLTSVTEPRSLTTKPRKTKRRDEHGGGEASKTL